MPRQSSASLALPRVDIAVARPQPSTDLSPEALEVFEALVDTVPRNHFRASDGPVIEAYASAVAQSRRAARELIKDGPITAAGRPSPWAKVQADAAKTIAALAMRLRLCPQARQTSRSTGRQRGYTGPLPWE